MIFPLALLISLVTLAASHGGSQCISFIAPVTISNVTTLVPAFPPFPNGYAAVAFINDLTLRDGNPATLFAGETTVTATVDISAQYCTPGPHATTLQILTHGLGFDKAYWDFVPPFKTNVSYSYVAAALADGFATLSYDRLGTGLSSKPDPYTTIQVGPELAVLATLTAKARAGTLNPSIKVPSKVVHVGHSYGSILTNALVANFPTLTNGIVLTGYSNNFTFQGLFLASTGGHLASLNQPARFHNFSTGYVTWPDKHSNQYSFLYYPHFDPNVLTYAESTKWPFTIGEITTSASFPSPNYTGPALLFAAAEDLIFCGGDCNGVVNGPYSTSPSIFSAAKPLDIYIQPNIGHGINLHYNATGAYGVILNWIQKNVC